MFKQSFRNGNFSFPDSISCGNEILSPHCSLCPKLNDSFAANWCGGNCKVDETVGVCQDKCMFPTITEIISVSTRNH